MIPRVFVGSVMYELSPPCYRKQRFVSKSSISIDVLVASPWWNQALQSAEQRHWEHHELSLLSLALRTPQSLCAELTVERVRPYEIKSQFNE